MGGMLLSVQQQGRVFDAQNSTYNGWFLSTQNSKECIVVHSDHLSEIS